jgi:hypothetical protein
MDSTLIQQMPIQMLAPYRNPDFSPTDDLALMSDIMENGVQDPIVLSVGVWSRKARLDTGNHRIYLAPRLGMTHLPVICRVWNYCAFSNGNGDHSFDCQYITPKREWIQDEYYAKPSDVLDIMAMLTAL